MPPNHLILCHSLLLMPSVFPSIRVFSSELAFHIRWPNYWSFSISPSIEYSGLIFFRIEGFDLLASQGTIKSLLQHCNRKHQFFGTQPSLWSNSHICTCVQYMYTKSFQLCLCDTMDCRSSGSSVHGILQARILEWVVISFSRRSSWPRDPTHISCVCCFGRYIL